ncbi:triose-phosphate isomerase [Egibacter rhizosphaerae]|uniref:Triosephosphate isomerase n=1 Tax=Egibacter rhizosphaerae TaxID=1670831 RepID=A0A411YKL5_9ACTN|nr:triose-phosphate isomerase [Egibacter rhizosphaerae]QBI21759.1 triose-phosphate isomerase [Egibacter rhizosphaerae]
MSTRTPFIAGNWKMHLDHLEAIQLVQQLSYRLNPRDIAEVEIAVIPPFTALRSIQTLIEGDKLELGLGAQDAHWEDSGAYTGAVAPPMLAKLAVDYVLVGHSERRSRFGDDDDVVARKLGAVQRHGMIPILCVGETLEERDAGRAEEVVDRQLRAALAGLDRPHEVVIAYEPVWAIGTGRTATPDDADHMCAAVRRIVGEIGGDTQAVRVQYGGSVKAGNAGDLLARPDIDGALVGGASLDPDGFAAICRAGREGAVGA